MNMNMYKKIKLSLSVVLVAVLAVISTPSLSQDQDIFSKIECDFVTGFDLNSPEDPREDGLTTNQVKLVCLYRELNKGDAEIQALEDDYEVLDFYEEKNPEVDVYDEDTLISEIGKLETPMNNIYNDSIFNEDFVNDVFGKYTENNVAEESGMDDVIDNILSASSDLSLLNKEMRDAILFVHNDKNPTSGLEEDDIVKKTIDLIVEKVIEVYKADHAPYADDLSNEVIVNLIVNEELPPLEVDANTVAQYKTDHFDYIGDLDDAAILELANADELPPLEVDANTVEQYKEAHEDFVEGLSDEELLALANAGDLPPLEVDANTVAQYKEDHSGYIGDLNDAAILELANNNALPQAEIEANTVAQYKEEHPNYIGDLDDAAILELANAEPGQLERIKEIAATKDFIELEDYLTTVEDKTALVSSSLSKVKLLIERFNDEKLKKAGNSRKRALYVGRSGFTQRNVKVKVHPTFEEILSDFGVCPDEGCPECIKVVNKPFCTTDSYVIEDLLENGIFTRMDEQEDRASVVAIDESEL